ncbi:MAG: efflux RND transporter periplasmic adaptor subunit [Desulfobulbaceae bacterium]|nr:efflux RND transporter periplasmic adaptor subunit [Desulfobulbaceae bacterium]
MRILLLFLISSIFSLATGHAQEQPPAKVVVRHITREVVAENQTFIGVLDYDRTSRVSSEVAGLVQDVLVREGQRMKKGDPLIRLDTEILDQEIAMYETRIQQDQLSIDHARKNLTRFEKLLARKGTSERIYDDTLHEYQDLRMEKKLSGIELEKLLTRQRKSVIKAPFDGIILEKNIETGDWVQQGKQLVSIGSLNDTIIRVPAEESILRFIAVGDKVPLTINALGREMTGTILQISPKADIRTKNIFIKVAIAPFDDMIANMSATVHLPTSDARELSIIPRDALVRFEGKDFVYTVKEGKASLVPVTPVTFLGRTVGADDPHLTEGLPVVVEGNERLRPDQPVTMQDTD